MKWFWRINDLVAIDGVAYNANEIGNYIWAMVLTYNGVFISPNLIAKLATLKDSWFKDNLITVSDEISGTTIDNNLFSIFANGLFHPETFIGSAAITVKQHSTTELFVTVFNVTSLTSGDYMKHMPWNTYFQSIIRDTSLPQGDERNHYANISQTYSFTIPIEFNRLKL